MGDYQQYHYEMFDLYPEHPLKMISQQLYDHAAEHGFPPDFFTNSYFDSYKFICTYIVYYAFYSIMPPRTPFCPNAQLPWL